MPSAATSNIPAMTACSDVTIDTAKHSKDKGWNGGAYKTADRYESNLTAIDPVTGEIKKTVHLRYPNYSGTVSTGGGLVFLGPTDGTVAAFDDTTLEQLWKIHVGSGFSAPPMTFEVGGRAVYRDCVRAERFGQGQARQHAGAQGPAPSHRAVRFPALSGTGGHPGSGSLRSLTCHEIETSSSMAAQQLSNLLY